MQKSAMDTGIQIMSLVQTLIKVRWILKSIVVSHLTADTDRKKDVAFYFSDYNV